MATIKKAAAESLVLTIITLESTVELVINTTSAEILHRPDSEALDQLPLRDLTMIRYAPASAPP